jgi:hypothetical protein
MSLPENVNVVRVRGYWLDQSGQGTTRSINFQPLPCDLVTDSGAFAYISTTNTRIVPDPTTGYFYADLIATNDPDLTPFTWKVTLQGQPPFTIEVDYQSPTVDVGDGVMMQAVWLVDAATTTVPQPISSYYTKTQTDAAITTAIDGINLGAATSLTTTAVAAAALSGHQIVTPAADGTVNYADNTSTPSGAPLWMTTGAVTQGTSATVLTAGPWTEPSWTWTPGPIYLGAAGVITQTVPTAPAFLAQIGYATTPTSIVLDRWPSIILAS